MENSKRRKTSTSKTSGRAGSRGVETESFLLNSCLRILSIRPRSHSEIIDHLNKKTSNQEIINKIVEKLKSSELINDEKFALWLTQSRARSRPRGKRILIQELKSKGIVGQNALDAISSSGSEIELAKKAIAKKVLLWEKLPQKEFKEKVSRFLYSRGFSWDIIERIVKNRYNEDNVS